MKRIITVVLLAAMVTVSAAKQKNPALQVVRFGYVLENGRSGHYDMIAPYIKGNAVFDWCITRKAFSYSVPATEATFDDIIWTDDDAYHYYAVMVLDEDDFYDVEKWQMFAEIHISQDPQQLESVELWSERLFYIYMRDIKGGNKKAVRR